MYAQRPNRGLVHTIKRSVALVLGGMAAIASCAAAAQEETGSTPSLQPQQPGAPETLTHMSEALRTSVRKIVVIGSPSPTEKEITGSYEKTTPGVLGGISQGSRAGSPSTQIGSVNVTFPIPILTLPGAIVGGISGKAKRDMQKFRDELTDDLATATDQPLTNEKLASAVYWSLQSVPGLDLNLFASTTPIPGDTDAVMYVSVKNVTIDVESKNAILTATAEITLRRPNDEEDIYHGLIQYQDRDTLANWTKNENALWRDYAQFAKHYLGREISAEVFDRIDLNHELRPIESQTVELARKNDWQGTSRSATPTLAWELKLLGGDSYGPWAETIDESNIYYDVEIYDAHRLVYAQEQIPDPVHTLVTEIDGCKTYRWSVRPSYHIGSDVRFGEWMRSTPKTITGIIGRNASEAPAYIQDFAQLKIDCRRR